MEPLLVTVKEAQEILHVGRNRMYGLVKTKEIPSIKIGTSIRIEKAALEEWIKKQGKG